MRRFFIIVIVSISPLLIAPPRGSFGSSSAGKSYAIAVDAGPHDRRDTAVSFPLPKETRGGFYWLRDEAGQVIPLQVDARHQAWFILNELKAGARKVYRLEAAQSAEVSTDRVQVIREKDGLQVTVVGHPVLRYQAAKELPRADIKPIYQRGGYIHPVLTPAGRIVTDDYPPNHLHHHGLWFAWTKTEFEGRHPDFWNMGDGTGTVELDSLGKIWSGPVHGGFRTQHRYVDLRAPEPKTALNEVWEVTVYRVGQGKRPYWMFDLVSTQACATASPLALPEYRYGGMGFRGHRQWNGKDNAFFLTSEGKDRSNGHATRARWCHIGGRVDGELAGIAILGHPDNFRAPQPMRIHPSEPFFNFAPAQMGPWEITPGRPYVSRYRYVVHDGPPDKDELERLWDDYAHPPQVTITVR